MIVALTVTGSVSRHAGGMEYSVRRLTQELSRQPDMIAEAVGVHDEASAADSQQWAPVPVTVLPSFGPKRLAYAPGLYEHLQSRKPSIVHVHGIWMYLSSATSRWASATGCPYLISPHGMLDVWAVRHSWIRKQLALLLYERKHLRGATALRALCMAEVRAIRRFGLAGPCLLLPNGVDIPLERAAGNQDGRPTLLYVGRLHEKKGLLPLVEAWAIAMKSSAKLCQWQLDIVGWGEKSFADRLSRLIAERGLEDHVRLRGPRFGDQKADVFRRADAFILPSYSEGLPMAVLEAWSYGLPVLMTDECNIPEGFTDDAAMRIETQEHRMAEKLQAFLELSESDRWTMGERGLALVKRRFNWGPIGATLAEAYKWALGGGPAPAAIV